MEPPCLVWDRARHTGSNVVRHPQAGIMLSTIVTDWGDVWLVFGGMRCLAAG